MSSSQGQPQEQSPNPISTLPTKVALARFSDDVDLGGLDLGVVAKALGRQINTDVFDAWGVAANVRSVDSLDEIADDEVPLVVVDKSRDLPDHGFHINMGGRQCAIVTNDAGMWTAYASHELIELLCDPSGMRTTLGRSLETDQGKVSYLVEVCDPVEDSTYVIEQDGIPVLVSDFVLPSYYADDGTSGAKEEKHAYSAQLTQRFGLLEGGYISWQVLGTAEVYRALAGDPGAGTQISSRAADGSSTPREFTGELTIERLGDKVRPQQKPSARISRQWDEAVPAANPRSLQADIETLIEVVKADPPLPTIDDIIADLEPLKGDDVVDRVISALMREQQIAQIFGDDAFGTGISSFRTHLNL